MRRLGCFTPLGLIAALITLSIVGGVALTSKAAMFSPGALSTRSEDGQLLGGVKSHAELVGDCTACHVDPWSSAIMATRCLACHTDVRAQLDDPNSLHSALPDVKVCRACHSEHNGATAALTHVSLQNFPHDRLKFTLAAHQTLSNGQPFTCADCHGENVAEFDRAQCETCHREYQEDFVTTHVADFGGDCLACHDGVDRFSNFDHNRLKFTLSGEHGQIACGQCHARVRAVADFTSAASQCSECHRDDDAHNGAFGADCGQCHTSDGWEDATFDHNLAAFKLTGAHLTVPCAQCHVNGVFTGTPQTCVGCHAEPQEHLGAFGTDCAQCHTTQTWQGAQFDHVFPLNHGEGGNIACQTCHTTTDFKQYTCYGCHEHDPADIQEEHLKEGIGDFQDCVRCHDRGQEGD
jgi:hypothetical protein